MNPPYSSISLHFDRNANGHSHRLLYYIASATITPAKCAYPLPYPTVIITIWSVRPFFFASLSLLRHVIYEEKFYFYWPCVCAQLENSFLPSFSSSWTISLINSVQSMNFSGGYIQPVSHSMCAAFASCHHRCLTVLCQCYTLRTDEEQEKNTKKKKKTGTFCTQNGRKKESVIK
jgi:hypothetical protein